MESGGFQRDGKWRARVRLNQSKHISGPKLGIIKTLFLASTNPPIAGWQVRSEPTERNLASVVRRYLRKTEVDRRVGFDRRIG
jgi:hypothetical protein